MTNVRMYMFRSTSSSSTTSTASTVCTWVWVCLCMIMIFHGRFLTMHGSDSTESLMVEKLSTLNWKVASLRASSSSSWSPAASSLSSSGPAVSASAPVVVTAWIRENRNPDVKYQGTHLQLIYSVPCPHLRPPPPALW